MEEKAGPCSLHREDAVDESVQMTRKSRDLVYQRREKKGKERTKEGQLARQGLTGDQAEEKDHASVSGVSLFDPSVENNFRGKKGKERTKEGQPPAILDHSGLMGDQAAEENHASLSVSPFDPSVQNHFREKKGKERTKEGQPAAILDRQGLMGGQAEEKNHASVSGVSPFDHSVENHFRAMDKISVLCGEEEDGVAEEAEMNRLSEMVTFLSEWKDFNYKPRTIRFASEVEGKDKDVLSEISLSQFSSAAVPKVEMLSNEPKLTPSRNDFVFYAGGSVWALDWCPRLDNEPKTLVNGEFIAVSAHPPDSAHHKLGAPLSGRGMVQIWCLLNDGVKEEDLSLVTKLRTKSQKKISKKEEDDTQPKKKRGRPRKHPVSTPANLYIEQQPDEMLSMEFRPGGDSNIASTSKENDTRPKRARGRPKKHPVGTTAPANLVVTEQPVELLANITRPKRARGKPKKHPVGTTAPANLVVTEQPVELLANEYPESRSNITRPKRARGRPKKHPVETTAPAKLAVTEQSVELLANESPESRSNITAVAKENHAQPKRRKVQHNNQVVETASSNMDCQNQAAEEVLAIEYPGCSSSNNSHADLNLLNNSSSKADSEKSLHKRKGKAKPQCLNNNNEHSDFPFGIHHTDMGSSSSTPIPKDILPPRVVLCLGHNGKVAWDVKWKPYNTSYSDCKCRLGYLAVLLGDGSLEVWEIPSPRMLKAIYLSRKQDRIDPRFVKLKPVFRCSMVRSGDRQSIPLTLEWSTTPPHDLILAGCHDGTVALWKFSSSSSSKDVRPMLCFSADTLPIRTLAWAPSAGDTEGCNVIVTAGHEGMKFWDLRDPFRPLWDISAQRFIYSLDWIPDPRCILTSYDDGTLRILSLAKAAYDSPATGKPFAGTPQQGIHTYTCSPFSIWSIQVSPHTGMVAYCGSNGTVLNFQLTSKAVDKDPHRNRTPHFLCGSLTNEDGTLVVNTPLRNTPYPMRRSINEWGSTPRSLRGFIFDSNKVRREAKETKQLHNQPLALCYDGEGDALDEEDLDEPISNLKNVKCKKKSKEAKKGNEDEASTSKVQEKLTMKEADVNLETGSQMEMEIEVLPSKLVAMHRVRWNVNKGSKRWLCYGGASGIVRCQEIIPTGKISFK